MVMVGRWMEMDKERKEGRNEIIRTIRYWEIEKKREGEGEFSRKCSKKQGIITRGIIMYDDGSTCLAFSCKVSHHRNQYHHCHQHSYKYPFAFILLKVSLHLARHCVVSPSVCVFVYLKV